MFSEQNSTFIVIKRGGGVIKLLLQVVSTLDKEYNGTLLKKKN